MPIFVFRRELQYGPDTFLYGSVSFVPPNYMDPHHRDNMKMDPHNRDNMKMDPHHRNNMKMNPHHRNNMKMDPSTKKHFRHRQINKNVLVRAFLVEQPWVEYLIRPFIPCNTNWSETGPNCETLLSI